MGLQGYVGSAEDKLRIQRQQKQRELQQRRYQEIRDQVQAKVEGAGLREFGAGTSEVLETAFKNETIGLVTREEFLEKRTTLEQRIEAEVVRRKRAAEEAKLLELQKRKKLKAKEVAKQKLSFVGDEQGDDNDDQDNDVDENEEEVEEEEDRDQDILCKDTYSPSSTTLEQEILTSRIVSSKGVESEGVVVSNSDGADSFNEDDVLLGSKDEQQKDSCGGRRFGKLGKDPSVQTDFLPDKDRELQEEELREQLKKEWMAKQQQIKLEKLEVVYSYWDGTGHRRKLKLKKGDSVGFFLKKVREQLAPDFREMRHALVDNLMFIKEDIIIPHNYSFYDLISSQARGKSGPLFRFDAHEDLVIQADSSVGKDDSHVGKVVERHWYDKNKHIFPASRWEIYDPEKVYDQKPKFMK